jgi:hypothetical protein
MPNNKDDDFETPTQPIYYLTEEELEWAKVMRARKTTRDLQEKAETATKLQWIPVIK